MNKPNENQMVELLTAALHYIAEMDGTVDGFLDDCWMIEDFYEEKWNEYFGFNEEGEII